MTSSRNKCQVINQAVTMSLALADTQAHAHTASLHGDGGLKGSDVVRT